MAAAKRKKPHPHEYDDEHEVISITDDGQPADDVDSDDSAPPQPVASTSGSHKARKTNNASSTSTANGKGKGKQRAEPEPEPDAMPIDAPLPPRPTASAREIERLRKLLRDRDARLQDALSAREALQRQVEELTKLRTTDAERSRDELRKEYDARVQTLEKLVQEQTTQLARVDKIARGSRSGTVHFITREVAADERRALERELTRVKSELNETSSNLKIAEEELKLERQSAKKRDAGGGKKGGDDARHHEWLVRFYEDGTNLLVTNIKPMATTMPARPQFTYMCLFTPEPAKSGLSLNFSLQTYLPDGASEEKFIYTPLGLENERPEYIDQLDFFRDSFQFKKAELPKFLRQLNDVLTNSGEEEEEEEEEE
ncbi:hypothetical protein AURDEDRAFT_114439 [Auricularia subglabra TFB-10046 SS5]|nr:hypothetical protein AURDEDRAFT_114439 [Auricularia subglabra TFB-10046 SS5]